MFMVPMSISVTIMPALVTMITIVAIAVPISYVAFTSIMAIIVIAWALKNTVYIILG